VFYVTDVLGGKITNENRQNQIREALEGVLVSAEKEEEKASA
jgi:hypothetical protein